MRRRERLRSVCVQYTVHRISTIKSVRVRNVPESQHEYSLCQATSAREPEVRSLSRSGGEQEQEQARRKRADRERELPSSNGVTALAAPCPIDDQASQSRSGDTKDGNDGVVSVGTIDGVGEGKLVLEVEYEEAVEEGVCEADQAPDKDEEGGVDSEGAGEEGTDVGPVGWTMK